MNGRQNCFSMCFSDSMTLNCSILFYAATTGHTGKFIHPDF